MIVIDSQSRQPIYEQIVEHVESLIAAGVMSQGEQLPSVLGTGGGTFYQSEYHPESIHDSGRTWSNLSGEGKRKFCLGKR